MRNPDAAYWWLRLLSVPGVGPVRYRALLARFGEPQAVFQASDSQLRTVDQIDAKTASAIAGHRDDNWAVSQQQAMARHQAFLLTIDQPDYPALLKKTDDAPPVLFVKGSCELNAKPVVAVVGSRLATQYGKATAELLGRDLSSAGFLVVSGMARGIDSSAHRGALSAGEPTVAVLGCGVDVVYPPENLKLRDQIAACGAVISEYPMGEGPLAGHFPNRNRIITGMSLGVVAVEARADSGVFSSVRWAADQGREVFAVPGPISSEASSGTNRLIKHGAKLVQSVNDIIEELRPQMAGLRKTDLKQTAPRLGKEEEPIFELLSDQPRHVDSLAQQAQRSVTEVLRALFDLEMRGLVRQLPGKMYIKA
jgi:DNA processing protein